VRTATLRLAAAVAMATAAGSLAARAAMPAGDGGAEAPAAELGPDGLPLPGRPPPAPPAPSPLVDLLRAPPTVDGMEEQERTLRTAALLPEPPPAPPPPVALEAPAAARRGDTAEVPAADPLAGVESGPGGGYRLRVTAGAPEAADAPAVLDPETARAAEAIGRRLAATAKEGGGGRVTVLAQVAVPPETEVSAQRRLALARALAVKGALVAGGVDPTRIDLRPLGRTEEGVDAVDILPPAGGPPGGLRRDAAGAAAVTR
jgi:hypothetical protein